MLHSKDITVGLVVCSEAAAAPANSRILHAIISQDSFVAAGPAIREGGTSKSREAANE